MTIQTLKEGFALMGASLDVTERFVMVSFKGITVTIDLTMTDDELKAALYFLNLNTPNWFTLVKQALAEERKEASHE